MNSIRLMFSMLVVAWLVTAEGFADQYPVPSAVSHRWELNFLPGPLRMYVDPVEQRPFWFFTYTVENRTGEEQVWAPRFVLYTDAGDILTSGENVPFRVTNDLIELLGDELIVNQNEVIGELLQGREHAREGIVIWPALDHHTNVTELSLFISGISGDTARIMHPLTRQPILLRKTLQRDYLVPGSPVSRGTREVEFVEQRWIFR